MNRKMIENTINDAYREWVKKSGFTAGLEGSDFEKDLKKSLRNVRTDLHVTSMAFAERNKDLDDEALSSQLYDKCAGEFDGAYRVIRNLYETFNSSGTELASEWGFGASRLHGGEDEKIRIRGTVSQAVSAYVEGGPVRTAELSRKVLDGLLLAECKLEEGNLMDQGMLPAEKRKGWIKALKRVYSAFLFFLAAALGVFGLGVAVLYGDYRFLVVSAVVVWIVDGSAKLSKEQSSLRRKLSSKYVKLKEIYTEFGFASYEHGNFSANVLYELCMDIKKEDPSSCSSDLFYFLEKVYLKK